MKTRLKPSVQTTLLTEMLAMLEETRAEYEDRVEWSGQEICRQRRLVDAELKPEDGLLPAGQSLLSGAGEKKEPPAKLFFAS